MESARHDRRSVDSLNADGGGEAEELLLERVRKWASRGRPAESDLEITVTYEEDQARLAVRWPPLSDGRR